MNYHADKLEEREEHRKGTQGRRDHRKTDLPLLANIMDTTRSAKKAREFERSDGKSFSEKYLDIGSSFDIVGDGALKNKSRLKKAELAPHIQKVGIQSFAGCTSLHTIHFGNLRQIHRGAFEQCVKLRQAVLPSTVEYVGSEAFRDCKRLEQAVFVPPSRVTVIQKQTFEGCAQMRSVQLPQDLVSIEAKAFYRCQSLEEIWFPDSLVSIGREAFYFNGLKSLVFPRHLHTLGDSAFFKSKQLEYVFIPKSVTHIGKWIFHGSDRLKVLEIHHDPAVIGDWITNKSTVIRCRKGSKMAAYCDRFGMQTEWI